MATLSMDEVYARIKQLQAAQAARLKPAPKDGLEVFGSKHSRIMVAQPGVVYKRVKEVEAK